MRRAPGLIDISRRDFCAFACGVALVACSDHDSSIVQTGALGPGDDDDGNPIDAPEQPPDDGSVTTDGSVANACVGTATDCYQPIEGHYKLTRGVIEDLREVDGELLDLVVGEG